MKTPMSKIRRKLTKFEGLCQTHCGYEESVAKAVDARFDLEDLIQAELKVSFDRGIEEGLFQAGKVTRPALNEQTKSVWVDRTSATFGGVPDYIPKTEPSIG